MDIVSALFGIAKHTLSIYETKDARKYLERVLYLEKTYRFEENRPDVNQNHALMDNCVAELCLITDTIAKFEKPKS
jgi:hypothetical protein